MSTTIIPLGQVPQKILRKIKKDLEETYHPILKGFEVEKTVEIPSESYNPERNQYNAKEMLDHVIKMGPDEGKTLAVTTKDLYSENLNFVFGQAQSPGKTAIISIHRLKPEFYGQGENQELLLERAGKEAIHEIGHTLGLRHCKNSECVMSFSNSIYEVDEKLPSFCDKCRGKIDKKIRRSEKESNGSSLQQ